MSAHLQHLMHAGGSRLLVPPDPAGADGTLLVPPQGPSGCFAQDLPLIYLAAESQVMMMMVVR